jgi:cystathionine beta-lyase/cystathionine gamma-synthase
LISGHTSAHQELEEALANYTGQEKALLFSTGLPIDNQLRILCIFRYFS